MARPDSRFWFLILSMFFQNRTTTTTARSPRLTFWAKFSQRGRARSLSMVFFFNYGVVNFPQTSRGGRSRTGRRMLANRGDELPQDSTENLVFHCRGSRLASFKVTKLQNELILSSAAVRDRPSRHETGAAAADRKGRFGPICFADPGPSHIIIILRFRRDLSRGACRSCGGLPDARYHPGSFGFRLLGTRGSEQFHFMTDTYG